MKVVQVAHDGNKPYLFETSMYLPAGAGVIVETAGGKTIGRVVRNCVEIPDDVAEYILPYFLDMPLRKVLGVVDWLTDEGVK